MQVVEEAINFNNKHLDDICQSSLPALTSRVEKVATSLGLQTLDVDVHRRKWSLTIQGVKGSVGEAEMDTRLVAAVWPSRVNTWVSPTRLRLNSVHAIA